MVNVVDEIEDNGKLNVVISARSRRTLEDEETNRESAYVARCYGYDPSVEWSRSVFEHGPFDFRSVYTFTKRLGPGQKDAPGSTPKIVLGALVQCKADRNANGARKKKGSKTFIPPEL